MSTTVQREASTRLYEKAFLIRAVEQRLLELFSEGKLFGTVHTCIGQEWTGVAVAEALEEGDLVFSNHRCHGHFLARTGDVDGLVAEIMGKQTGICGGRGGSQHICSQGFFSNGIQGGIVPVTAGLALAQQLRETTHIAVVFIGDGTLGQGVVYEAMNIASNWDLPMLIVLEHNLYAQSTPHHQTLAGDICARAEAFGIRTKESHTWAPEELVSEAADAVAYVRTERKPFFLRVDTYRLMAHSKGDDDRDQEEVQTYWDKDSLTAFLKEQEAEALRIEARNRERIDAAVAKAEAAAYAEPIETGEESPPFASPNWKPVRMEKSERVVNRIHAALKRNMAKDERIVVLGEDIEGPYGGAFKVTKDLNAEFPGRVRNTPISEASIVGVGNGLALAGMRPVCEIMFGDFIALAADQIINHAAKFRYMYNDQVHAPIIIRTPMGGRRGYGATHSQSIEKHLLGVPGTLMLAVNHRSDPALLYDELFASLDQPALVIENKLLYGVRVSDKAPEGFVLEETDERFPTVRLRPEGPPDVTLLCYGGMLQEVEPAVEQLFEEQEVIAEVVCPTQLYPLNPWPVVESLSRTGRLVIVEEGCTFAAFGAEAVAEIAERAGETLRRLKRVGPPRHAIPSCGPLEKAILPSVQHVVDAVGEIVNHG